MTKRDDFRAKTKRTLEARVGHKCSNPGCQRPTSGPAAAENKAVSVGKAAHITAAAINGPRYDSSLSPEERRAETNGSVEPVDARRSVLGRQGHFDGDV
jgi:hypothetical protein